MKFLPIFIFCSTFSTRVSSGRVNFGTEEAELEPQSLTRPSKDSEPNCACVPKDRCGTIQPREEAQQRNSFFESNENGYASSSSSSSGSRIVNDPPPGVFCLAETVYCCNIRPQPVVVPVIIGGEPAREKPSVCGVRTSYSVFAPRTPGFARYGEYPWMAIILKNDGSDNIVASGTLLNDFTVITTAHNVKNYLDNGKSLKVRVGDFYTDPKTEFPFVEVKVESIRIHKDFNSNLQNDIAVIKLDPSCAIKQKNPNINFICLPEKDVNLVGRTCWVPGYGITESGKASAPTLRHVDLTVRSGNQCQELLEKSLYPGFNFDRKSFLCAGGEPGKDSCVGDGGSALVCQREDGRWEMAGIVSWGVEGKCGRGNVPGVYTNVASFVNWINEQ